MALLTTLTGPPSRLARMKMRLTDWVRPPTVAHPHFLLLATPAKDNPHVLIQSLGLAIRRRRGSLPNFHDQLGDVLYEEYQ